MKFLNVVFAYVNNPSLKGHYHEIMIETDNRPI
jgi:hypothetical protein